MPVNVTVNAVCPNVQYVADGKQTEFGFPFAIFSADDLEVYLNQGLQVEGFSITINLQTFGDTSGGSVLFNHPPAAGTKITLIRKIVIQRTTNFQESGELRARVLNYELDYLTAALQQLEEVTDRSVHLHPTDTSAEMILPIKDDRAGKALVFDTAGNVSVATLPTATAESKISLDDILDGTSNRHFTSLEKVKLDSIEQGAQVNPSTLDALPDGVNRFAITADERSKLSKIAIDADANPPKATDAEIIAGTSPTSGTVSPAQIKTAVTTFSPVTAVAGRSGAVTLSQADVAGTVPSSRAITAGAGLTGGGNLTIDRSIAVNLATSGGTAGTATTVARADHTHAVATTTANGLLAAADKTKLDSVATGAQVNPPAATDAEITTGTVTTTRTVSPAQIKTAVTTFSPVTSVAGRSGAVTLSQADVAGTVPSSRTITAGVGLTGGGDLSKDLAIYPDTFSDSDITNGTSTAPKMASAAQLKLAAQTWGGSSASELANGLTIFVAPAGNDKNNGLSANRAMATLGAAMRSASALSPSNTNRVCVLVVGGGSFSENVTIPQYVSLHAPGAVIAGTVTVNADSYVRVLGITPPSNTTAIAASGSGVSKYSIVHAEFVTLAGTGTGVTNTASGIWLQVNIGTLTVDTGYGIGAGATAGILATVTAIVLGSNSAVGITTGGAPMRVTCTHIVQASGVTSATAISQDVSAIMDITAQKINAGTAWIINHASAVVNILAHEVSGIRTITSGVVNDITAVGSSGSPDAVDFAGGIVGTPATNDIIALYTQSVAWAFTTADCIAYAETAPTGGSPVFSLKKNGTQFATITFGNGEHNGIFAGSVTSFAVGDRLTIESPANVYSLADISYIIAGQLS